MGKNLGDAAVTEINKSTLLRIAGTIISIGLLIVLLSQQGWEQILDAVRDIPAWIFLITMLLMIISRFIITGRWHVLLRAASLNIRYIESLKITFAGLFATNFLPTTIGGDVVRLAGMIRQNYDAAISTASLIADRLVGMVGMAIVIPLALPSLLETGGLERLFPRAESQIQAHLLATILPAWFQKIWSKGIDALRNLFKALTIWFKNPLSLVISLGLTGTHMLSIYAIFFLLLSGMGEQVSYWLIGALYSLVYFFTLLPISINGYGLQELSITVVFSNLGGISVSSAITMALIFRTLMMIASLPGAFLLPGVMAGKPELDESIPQNPKT